MYSTCTTVHVILQVYTYMYVHVHVHVHVHVYLHIPAMFVSNTMSCTGEGSGELQRFCVTEKTRSHSPGSRVQVKYEYK